MSTTLTKPSFVNVLKTGLIAGVIALVANGIVYLLVGLAQPMTIPIGAVIINTVLGLLVGSLLYFVLSRFLGTRTNLVFTIICVVFLVAYAYMPIYAMSQEPAPGMGTFNTATVAATEVMHLISGGLAIVLLRRLMR